MTQLAALEGVARIGGGKVRELYAVGEDQILLVATDRISAFDVVLPTPIPDKGKVLTGLSVFWFGLLDDVVPNHLRTADVAQFPASLQRHADALHGRAMLCRRAHVLPVECVARGYLAGSGWAEYAAGGRVCGIPVRQGLREADELPEPLFTPATKATSGHDENITFEQAAEIVTLPIAAKLRELTLELYGRARDYACERGIILADTKFEFGLVDGEIVLVDEVLTPDSSRFWPADEYEPGHAQASFDKQYVRDWLLDSGWERQPPGPELPGDVVAATRERYVAAYEQLTGRAFEDWGFDDGEKRD